MSARIRRRVALGTGAQLSDRIRLLNATRKRRDNIAMGFSVFFFFFNGAIRQIELRENCEESHAVQTPPITDHDATMMSKKVVSASDTMRSLLREKKSLTYRLPFGT